MAGDHQGDMRVVVIKTPVLREKLALRIDMDAAHVGNEDDIGNTRVFKRIVENQLERLAGKNSGDVECGLVLR